jgi:hypothetical protein
MGLFQELEGDCAVIIVKGVYKQCPLYTRNGYLYAKTSGGFVKLMSDASTSQPSVRVETLVLEQDLKVDGMGRLMVGTERGKLLEGPRKSKLLEIGND